jgi:hypothetical protein
MKFKFFVPLIGFIVPTIVITLILFTLEPPHISQRIGFIFLVLGACGSYYLGVKNVLDDKNRD